MSRADRQPPLPTDFGGQCLIGETVFDRSLLLPTTQLLGLPKDASYLYGTWRDEDGNLLRALRGVEATASTFAHLFEAAPGRSLERHEAAEATLFRGATSIEEVGDEVHFRSIDGPGFAFDHLPAGCRWQEDDLLDLVGTAVAPAIQWFNPWPGGGCYSATGKYRVSGSVLGRRVEGFVGHEIHYFPPEENWITSPYGQGREICWQQIANEYEDGAIEQATFAHGADGWGFAMVHDEHGQFHATTDVEVRARVRENGYPEEITYVTAIGTWIWRLDPQGERARTFPSAPFGADGTCTREGEERAVLLSMGNSDWWTDGRADHLIVGRS